MVREILETKSSQLHFEGRSVGGCCREGLRQNEEKLQEVTLECLLRFLRKSINLSKI